MRRAVSRGQTPMPLKYGAALARRCGKRSPRPLYFPARRSQGILHEVHSLTSGQRARWSLSVEVAAADSDLCHPLPRSGAAWSLGPDTHRRSHNRLGHPRRRSTHDRMVGPNGRDGYYRLRSALYRNQRRRNGGRQLDQSRRLDRLRRPRIHAREPRQRRRLRRADAYGYHDRRRVVGDFERHACGSRAPRSPQSSPATRR